MSTKPLVPGWADDQLGGLWLVSRLLISLCLAGRGWWRWGVVRQRGWRWGRPGLTYRCCGADRAGARGVGGGAGRARLSGQPPIHTVRIISLWWADNTGLSSSGGGCPWPGLRGVRSLPHWWASYFLPAFLLALCYLLLSFFWTSSHNWILFATGLFPNDLKVSVDFWTLFFWSWFWCLVSGSYYLIPG